MMRWKKRKKDRLSGEILLLSEHIQNELLTFSTLKGLTFQVWAKIFD